MPVYLPQFLSSKAYSQSPFSVERSFETVVVDMESGPRHVYSRYGAGLVGFPTGPLSRFECSLMLTDSELTDLRDFYDAVDGSLEEFIFLNPVGNLVQYSEDFSAAQWSRTSVTVGAAANDPIRGARARTLTATSSNSNMVTTVLPVGDAVGKVITGSIWVKPASSQQMVIGFVDSGFTVLASAAHDVVAGQWRRITVTHTLASTSYIRLLIGGFGSWNMTALDFFGAQCVALPGPGAYVKSPAFYGYHAKCRFDMDEFTWKRTEPNGSQVTISIKEIF